MEIAIGWFLFSIVVGVLASNRGRSGLLWFFFSLIFSPLFVGLLCLVSQDLSKQGEGATGGRAEAGSRSVESSQTKDCPDCAETVKFAAKKCRYCGYIFPEEEVSKEDDPLTSESGLATVASIAADGDVSLEAVGPDGRYHAVGRCLEGCGQVKPGDKVMVKPSPLNADRFLIVYVQESSPKRAV